VECGTVQVGRAGEGGLPILNEFDRDKSGSGIHQVLDLSQTYVHTEFVAFLKGDLDLICTQFSAVGDQILSQVLEGILILA